MFDSDDDYCAFCAERREGERRKQEEEKMDARLYNQLANFLSRGGKHRYTPEEAKQMLLKK